VKAVCDGATTHRAALILVARCDIPPNRSVRRDVQDLQMPNASVTLLYHADEPQRYVARLGATGWYEGWGWTVDQALEDLARVGRDVGLPDLLPTAARADESKLVAWLRRRAGEPVLAS
jgi:hypothetical protein